MESGSCGKRSPICMLYWSRKSLTYVANFHCRLLGIVTNREILLWSMVPKSAAQLRKFAKSSLCDSTFERFTGIALQTQRLSEEYTSRKRISLIGIREWV